MVLIGIFLAVSTILFMPSQIRKGLKEIRRRNNDRGIALLIVLLIITLMGVMIFEFNHKTRIDMVQARNRADWTKAFYIARSGINGMKEILIEDSKDSNYDGLDELWAQEIPGLPLGAGSLSIKVVDEAAKFDINTLLNNVGKENGNAPEIFGRLLEEIGMDSGLKDDIVEFVREKKDARYKIDDLSELLDLDVIDLDDLNLLENVVTTNSKGKININTAPEEVVISLSDRLTQTMVDEIITYRKEEPFKKTSEVKNASAGIDDAILSTFSGVIDVRSDYFTIYSKADVNGIIKDIMATISREGRKIKVLKWKEK